MHETSAQYHRDARSGGSGLRRDVLRVHYDLVEY